MDLLIRCPVKKIDATIHLPASKSITNRTLIIRALCTEKFEILHPAESTDSAALAKALENSSSFIDVNDAGTAYRFLTAYLSLIEGSFFLTGSERMKARPVGPLVDALKELGASIQYIEKEGFPPLKIEGGHITGGKVDVSVSDSSQYLSALLLIGPNIEGGLKIDVEEGGVSWPYIELTMDIMKFFGASVVAHRKNGKYEIEVNPGKYIPRSLSIEKDWSSASFWIGILSLSHGGEIQLPGLKKNSMQGDRIITEIGNQFGVYAEDVVDGIRLIKRSDKELNEEFVFDFTDYPDLAVPVAVMCCALKKKSILKGIHHLRIKESDRVAALISELSKTGARVIDSSDELVIMSSEYEWPKEITFDTHNDHRLAMALAPLSLRTDRVIIKNAEVVSKSYPAYWDHLSDAGFRINHLKDILT